MFKNKTLEEKIKSKPKVFNTIQKNVDLAALTKTTVSSENIVSFDNSGWTRKLYDLNPWAKELWPETAVPGEFRQSSDSIRAPFAQMRLQAVLKRWSMGVTFWNAWAEAMWALRVELEEFQLWDTQNKNSQEIKNLFLHFAAVEFDYLCLPGGSDFSNFLFPGLASFRGTRFGDKKASPGDVLFCGTKFYGGEARFDSAQFDGGSAKFREAQFHGDDARFDGAQFNSGDVSFNGVQFYGGQAKFTRVQFRGGEVSFIKAQFHGGDASFQWSEFYLGDTSFRGAEFHGGDARFDGAKFQDGIAKFREAQFWGGNVSFRGAQFSGSGVLFSEAQFFKGHVSFEKVLFSGDDVSFVSAHFKSNDVSFEQARFLDCNARFANVKFICDSTSFNKALFQCELVEFDEARFSKGPALFCGVQFKGGYASFVGTKFHGGPAEFQEAQFHGGDAIFRRAEFHGGDASFKEAQFHGGAARFCQSQFYGGKADFQKAEFFGGSARFIQTRFHGGEAIFNGARFYHDDGAWFEKTQFHGGDVCFKGVEFSGHASFREVQFGNRETETPGIVDFEESCFKQTADYTRCQINYPISFARSTFLGTACFRGTQSNISFALNDVQFQNVPDFTQIIFNCFPRLDNARVRPALFGTVFTFSSKIPWNRILYMKWISRDRDAPAKFRELKQFAIGTEDNRSILNFRAEEIRSARWVTDWPSHSRFWFGYLYGLLSNFGRSIFRPLFLWLSLTLLFSCVYLSAHLDHNEHLVRYRLPQNESFTTKIDIARRAFWDRIPCTEGRKTTFIGLQPEVRNGTDAFSEALRMSLANAFVIGDVGGVESTRLSYGCLFGMVRPSMANPTPTTYVPSSVLWASRLQKMLSILFIFLFLLALRNNLK
ncbi:MAG: hypothetical protein TECD_01251 [Hyphomicrobiaceae bacterium hypho_1]